jgi:hypothetical protein
MPSRRPPAHEPAPTAPSPSGVADMWAPGFPAAGQADPVAAVLVDQTPWAPAIPAAPSQSAQSAPVVYAGSADSSVGPLYAFPPGPPPAGGPTATPAPGPVGEVSLSDPFPDRSPYWVAPAAAEV